MKTAIVIPARRASTRLPNKMLLAETGKPLLQHTYERACQSSLASRILIATDDETIQMTAQRFGAEVVMTASNHPTGTDRISEVAEKYLMDVDLIVNVQGDEPEIDASTIDALITLYQATDTALATLVTRFKHTASPHDPHCVKAVLGAPIPDTQGNPLGYQALYFSRSLIPYPREDQGIVQSPEDYFLHLGIYGYSPLFVQQYVRLPQGPLERYEKLEQLRVLEHGYKVVAGIVAHATPGIDTPADYEQFVNRYRLSATPS